MAYRDDKEAAYQRADALQRELDRTQAELERTKGKLVETERARDSLAKRVTSDVKPPLPLPAPQRRAGGAAISSLFVIGAMSAFALNSSRHHYSPPPPPIEMPKSDFADMMVTRQITLNSDPAGAQVYAKRAYGDEQLIGTTPLTMSVLDWTVQHQIEVRLDGYKPATVEVPLFDKTTNETTVTLQR